MNAKLIVLEGLDGSGKSTQIELIKAYFDKHKLKYAFNHFPAYNDNEFSSVIAAFLRGEYGNNETVNPYFVANIYAMDRFLYLPKLKKMLEENNIVILDRYVFSNMAFQAAKYPNASLENTDIKNWIYEFEFGFLELPYPDVNIFFDVPISIIEERLTERLATESRSYLEGKVDIHEGDMELQKRVRYNYLNCASYDNFEIIPCADKNNVLYKPKELFDNYKHIIDRLYEDDKKSNW